MKTKRYLWISAMLALGLLFPALGLAQEATEAAAALPSVAELSEGIGTNKILVDTIWVLVAAVLVIFMQAGFACVECGFVRAKNANNIMMKNVLDFCIGAVAFFVVGFAIMFGDGNGFMGMSGWFMSNPDVFENSLGWTTVPLMVKFIFQLAFAATAATIVSGAMAERTKFTSYMVYSVVLTAVIYPIVGHWIWGGGWLAGAGMWDFAGSTVVHSTGGWLALVGAFFVGARRGKYGSDGKPRAIPGHSIPMASLGVFILFIGWFGFNAGSTMAADFSVGLIAVNTALAAATGAIGALFASKILFKTFDISMTLNGLLAGLVAITAPCAFVSPGSSLIIGLLGGVAVVFSVVAIDRIKIDDPVGAISVHGVCGALGTICVGLFAQDIILPETTGNGLFYGGGATLLIAQLKGIVSVFLFCIVTGSILFAGIKYTIGLRVSAEEEEEGLDIGEHGLHAYPDPGFIGMGGATTSPTAAAAAMAPKVESFVPATES